MTQAYGVDGATETTSPRHFDTTGRGYTPDRYRRPPLPCRDLRIVDWHGNEVLVDSFKIRRATNACWRRDEIRARRHHVIAECARFSALLRLPSHRVCFAPHADAAPHPVLVSALPLCHAGTAGTRRKFPSQSIRPGSQVCRCPTQPAGWREFWTPLDSYGSCGRQADRQSNKRRRGRSVEASMRLNTSGEGCGDAGAPTSTIVPSRLNRTKTASKSHTPFRYRPPCSRPGTPPLQRLATHVKQAAASCRALADRHGHLGHRGDACPCRHVPSASSKSSFAASDSSNSPCRRCHPRGART